MKTSYLLVSLLLLAPGIASAEQGPNEGVEEESLPRFGFGLGAGRSVPLGPDVLTDNFETDSSFLLFGTGRITGPFSARVEFSHDEHGCDADACAELSSAKIRFSRVSAGLQASFGDQFEFYGFLTGGYYDQEVQIARDNEDLRFIVEKLGTSGQFGLGYGGGVNYAFSPEFLVGADVHFHSVFQDDGADAIWYVVPSIHAEFRF